MKENKARIFRVSYIFRDKFKIKYTSSPVDSIEGDYLDQVKYDFFKKRKSKT